MKKGSELARHDLVDLDLEGGRSCGRVLRTRTHTMRVPNVSASAALSLHELVLVWIAGEERPRWVDIARVQRRIT